MNNDMPWSAGRRCKRYWIILIAAVTALAGFAGSARGDNAFPHWEYLGPPSQALTNLAIAPSDPRRLYGTSGSRFWVSLDHGATWTLRTTEGSLYRGEGLAVSPSDPDLVLWGATTIRSTDGGRSWSPTGGYGSGREFVFAPADPSRVYAIGGQFEALVISGDSGMTWEPTFPTADQDQFYDLAVSETDRDLVYVATGDGLYCAKDGGRTLDPAGLQGINLALVALARTDGRVIYCVQNYAFSPARGALHVSCDEGATWQTRELNFGISGVVNVMDLLPDPADPGTVYLAAAAKGWDHSQHGLVARISEYGFIWERFGAEQIDREIDQVFLDPGTGGLWCRPEHVGPFEYDPADARWHPRFVGLNSNHTETFGQDPSDPNRLYVPVPELEGLFLTRDGGANWDMVITDAPIYREILVHPTQRELVLGCGGKPGFGRSADGGLTWETEAANQLFAIALANCPLLPARVFACALDVFQQTVLWRSEDFGLTWEPLPLPIDYADRGIDITVAPSDPDRIYAGLVGRKYDSYAVLRSDDGGDHWIAIQEHLRCNDLKQIVVDPQDSDVVYWHGGGRIRRSADGGYSYDALWTHMRNLPPTYSWSPSQLHVSDYDPKILYSGYSRSADGGNIWDARPGDIKKIPGYFPGSGSGALTIVGGPHPILTLAASGLFRSVDDFNPIIIAAGSHTIASTRSNILQFSAVVWDRDGRSDINSVLLAVPEYNIEVSLFDDGFHGDGNSNDGVFGLQIPIEFPFRLNEIFFTIVAIDLLGRSSKTWPYLESNQRILQEDQR